MVFGVGVNVNDNNGNQQNNIVQNISPIKKNTKKKPNKKNNNLLITLNHPNLLCIPTIQITSTNPYPHQFSLTKYIYNIAIDQWQ